MYKTKKNTRPCIWLVDGEWWCAVKSVRGYHPPLGHGRTQLEALENWKKLYAAYQAKLKQENDHE